MPAETDYVARARLADALARGESISEAARQALYSRENARLLMKREDFMAQVEKRKNDLAARPESPIEVEAAEDDRDTLRTFRAIRDDENEKAADRIAAGKAILGYGATRRKLAAKVSPNKPPPLRIVPDEDAAKRFLAGGGK